MLRENFKTVFVAVLILFTNSVWALEDKTNDPDPYGIALNPVAVGNTAVQIVDPSRFTQEDLWIFMSGSVSYFDYDGQREFTLPFVYERSRSEGESYPMSAYIDLECKQYFNETLMGKYAGVFLRTGEIIRDNDVHEQQTRTRFVGLGASIGYRYDFVLFGDQRLYSWVGVKGGVLLYKERKKLDRSSTGGGMHFLNHGQTGDLFLDFES